MPTLDPCRPMRCPRIGVAPPCAPRARHASSRTRAPPGTASPRERPLARAIPRSPSVRSPRTAPRAAAGPAEVSEPALGQIPRGGTEVVKQRGDGLLDPTALCVQPSACLGEVRGLGPQRLLHSPDEQRPPLLALVPLV